MATQDVSNLSESLRLESPEAPPLVEMRQVAGLTSGSAVDLGAGSFEFRESNRDVGFSLTVDPTGGVLVVPGEAGAMVAEIPIQQPTPLGYEVLNVGSACFTVRRPRPEPTPEGRLKTLRSARASAPPITVPEALETGGELRAQSSRFGVMFSPKGEDVDEGLNPAAWSFLESIRDTRSDVAERHRQLHPDLEELRSRLRRLDPGLWERGVDHPYFARFAVAYAAIPWEPRFDRPELIPLELHRPIREMSCLPWVPVTANLLSGPLGIVGSRSAVLAAANAAVVSLSALSAPDALEFSILTSEDTTTEWTWTAELPRNLSPSGGSAYRVAVADGLAVIQGTELDTDKVLRNEMGLIALGRSLDDLPDYCATVVQIDDTGLCTVTNHLGEQVNGTPIGLASGPARSLARSMAAAVDPVLPPMSTPDNPALDYPALDHSVMTESSAPDFSPSSTDDLNPRPPAPTHRREDK